MSGAPRKVRVFLSGEGSNELGSRFGHPSFQSDERPGVLHALLSRVQDGPAMVRVIEEADLAKVPEDARALRRWLERAEALPRRVAGRAGGV